MSQRWESAEGLQKARHVVLGAVLAVAAVFAGPSFASADVKPAEIEAYQETFSVSSDAAEERLQLQSKGSEADIAGELEQELEQDFAGLWFDNASSEFVVPITPDASRAAVRREFADAQLGGDYRAPVVDFSWEELEAAQAQINIELSGLIEAGLVQTSLDARTNAVVVDAAEGIGEQGSAHLAQLAAKAEVEVELRETEKPRFQAESFSCKPNFLERYCGKPLRGGVGIEEYEKEATVLIRTCTAGFPARGITNGKRYLLTAGHCIDSPSAEAPPFLYWDSGDQLQQQHYIGEVEQHVYPTHDWAKINATGSYWDIAPWPSTVAYWGEEQPTVVNESYPINGEASSYLFETVCHSGASTGTSCGTVTAQNQTVYFEDDGWLYGMNRVLNGCAAGGDSGGPVFASNMALGMLSGGEVDPDHPCNEPEWYYADITEATNALGVRIYPRVDRSPTQTTVSSASALNGNPGWATVKGNVTTPEGAPVNNRYVNIKLFKWENNNWVQKTNPPLQVPVTNSSFELKNWNGVGYGSWIAKAEFPAQISFAASESNTATEGAFTVKDGYQLVNPYSNKCLDVDSGGTANGVNLQQWSCLNPLASNGNNQVFTLEPLAGSNNFQLVARVSDRCADLINKGTVNGTWIQQWDCNGETQQRWETAQINASNGKQYTQLKTKHTSPGKCLEISGPNPNDGAKAQIWDCLGASQLNQMWTMKSVDAAPVATQTTAVVTQALNGEPGWASVEGEVKAGAHSINGQYVNVNFYKKISGSWTYIGTSQPTLSNNHFAVNNYVVGVGEWKAQAVFNQQGTLGASSSGEPQFTINKGYRLFNKYTQKCLDVDSAGMANGVNLQQWDCINPASAHLNQVFTLVPRTAGYYQLVAKHSGRCADVINSSTANGAWTQQWDCYGDGQFNQIWWAQPMPGGYVEFVNKLSNKCLEIGNGSLNNGAKAQQWDCYGYDHQQWGFQSVTW